MKFKEALKLDDKDIKANRIEIVNNALEVTYKRCIEDIEAEIVRVEAAREDMLDMSSDFKDSINLDKFNAAEFVNKDLAAATKLRDLRDSLSMITKRFGELF